VSLFEVIMLVCFASGWPFSIAKTIRTKRAGDKSAWFMTIVCLGYLSGIIHKLVYDRDWVIALYALNILLIATDLYLYHHYKNRFRFRRH
jgi:hypothetical protein